MGSLALSALLFLVGVGLVLALLLVPMEVTIPKAGAMAMLGSLLPFEGRSSWLGGSAVAWGSSLFFSTSFISP